MKQHDASSADELLEMAQRQVSLAAHHLGGRNRLPHPQCCTHNHNHTHSRTHACATSCRQPPGGTLHATATGTIHKAVHEKQPCCTALCCVLCAMLMVLHALLYCMYCRKLPWTFTSSWRGSGMSWRRRQWPCWPGCSSRLWSSGGCSHGLSAGTKGWLTGWLAGCPFEETSSGY